jgi:hypothetical protein
MSARIFAVSLSLLLAINEACHAQAHDGSAKSTSATSLRAHHLTAQSTVSGVISEARAGHLTDGASGFNFVLEGQSDLLVNLGRDVSPQIRNAIKSGRIVSVTGTVQKSGGQQVLRASEIAIAGKSYHLRSSIEPSTSERLQAEHGLNDVSGGAR